MVDNVSFVDEVNPVPKYPSIVPSALTIHSEPNNDNPFGSVLNNNNDYHFPNYGTYQQHSNEEAMQQCSGNLDGNGNASGAASCKWGNKWGTEGAWLTRSVTQPNLSATKMEASSSTALASASTHSEENVLEALDSNISSYGRMTNFSSSSPNSYDVLPGDVSTEYFDARSSLSAPVELLSEFLSALMSRDYKNALHLCQSILKYEPHNATALEFYPLLLSKIKQCEQSTTNDDTDATSDTEEEEEDGRGGGEEEEEEKEEEENPGNKVKRHINNNIGYLREKTKAVESTLDLSLLNMSASNSLLDCSAGFDSGRESLFSPNDSDVTHHESGDSLYSSTESNLNMIRSDSDSLFSSTDTRFTLASVMKSVQTLRVDGK